MLPALLMCFGGLVVADSVARSPLAATTSAGPWHLVMRFLMKELFELLGGQGAEIESAKSVEDAMILVAARYEQCGVPANLSPFALLELAALCEQAREHLSQAPSEVDAATVLRLEQVLSDLSAGADQ